MYWCWALCSLFSIFYPIMQKCKKELGLWNILTYCVGWLYLWLEWDFIFKSRTGFSINYYKINVLKISWKTPIRLTEREKERVREHICLHFWPFSSGFIQWVKVWRELLLTSICAFWAGSINVFCTESSLILISKGLRVTYFSVIFISPLPTSYFYPTYYLLKYFKL